MMAPAFRICREVSTRAGIALRPVGLAAMGIDSLSLRAPDAETALARARLLVADTRGLIAIQEAS